MNQVISSVLVSFSSSTIKLSHRRYLGLKNKKMRPKKKMMRRTNLTITMKTRRLMKSRMEMMSQRKTKVRMMSQMNKKRMMTRKAMTIKKMEMTKK